MPDLLLTVDVGNTATSFALFDRTGRAVNGNRLWTIGTSRISRSSELKAFLRRLARQARFSPGKLAAIVISSVVPAVDAPLARGLRAAFGLSPAFVTARTPSRVKIRYRAPREVGADRIVNARAAMALWNGPSIVVDFGTATTFDCITARKEYLGGVIAPGPVISAEALYQRTAKLPLVVLKKPARIVGRNTLESIQAGLYHGYRGLVKEILSQLIRKFGARTHVFATGGQAGWILNGLDVIHHHVPLLTHQGIFHVWNDGLKSR